MTDDSDDKTIAFGDSPAKAPSDRGGAAGIIETPKARLICLDPSQIDGTPNDLIITLGTGSEVVVGRGETCSFPIVSRKLSRQHARLFAGVGAWGVEDLNSTNGVMINRQKVKTAWLNHGDEVRIGPIPFRYEVDRPDLPGIGPVAPTARPGAGGDDADSDRTMMVGSLGASAAVLEAVRKVEKAPEEEAGPTAARHDSSPSGGGGKLVGILVAVLLLAAVGGGAYLYLPTYLKGQEIAEAIKEGDRVFLGIVSRAKELSRELGSTPLKDARFEEDLTTLAPAISKAERLLQANPGHTGLSQPYARLRFLAFEREFNALFAQERLPDAVRLAEALKAELATLRGRLPAATLDQDLERITAATELAGFAMLLTELRGFALQYPKVGRQAAAVPTVDRIRGLEEQKAVFTRYRRTYHNVLSVDYLLFNNIVKTVEERDIALLNHWKEYLASSGGTGN